jgi:hypothetical protein
MKSKIINENPNLLLIHVLLTSHNVHLRESSGKPKKKMHADSHLYTFVHTVKLALSPDVEQSRVISFASLQPLCLIGFLIIFSTADRIWMR